MGYQNHGLWDPYIHMVLWAAITPSFFNLGAELCAVLGLVSTLGPAPYPVIRRPSRLEVSEIRAT